MREIIIKMVTLIITQTDMKKISIYCLIGIFTLLNYSCDDAIEAFSNTQNYIYFNLPFELDRYGKVTTKRVDSLVYSFAMDNIDVKSYTFKVPVNTVGLESDVDRKYDIVINDSITTA